MKQYLIFLLATTCSFLTAQTSYNSNYTLIPTYTENEIRDRLIKMPNSVVSPYYDSVIRSYVKTYTVLKRDRTQQMLGRSEMYFPIFEKILTEKKMPMDLKYLSVLESALNPEAVSRSGAVGLWQFMPATGKEYGLSINSVVDERKDPHKATRAALTYLSKLYYKYNDWKLALAAYNGGPGRVNRAIKRGRSNSFSRIKKYLPRETRNYVSAYVAASYILNYFQHHNIFPLFPEYDLRYTSTVKLYERISFDKISELTGVPVKTIKRLNPSYKRNFIPPSSKGNFLILPEHTMASFLNYLGRPDAQYYSNVASSKISAPSAGQQTTYSGLGSIEGNVQNYFKTNYVVNSGENLDYLSNIFDCSKQDIMCWNRLNSMLLSDKQNLVIYLHKNKINRIEGFSKIDILTPVLVTPEVRDLRLPFVTKYPVAKTSKSRFGRFRDRVNKKRQSTVFYQIRRRETLLDIAEKFPGVSVQDILEQNNITNDYVLTPGTLLKIKVNNY